MDARILIVDDEEDVLELLAMSLENEGFTVETAQRAEEVMDKIKGFVPDLILLDVMLEEASGIDLTAKIKNTKFSSDIPVILLTAKDKNTDVVVGLKVGADDYITKPFNMDVLSARIEAVLRRFRSSGGNGRVLKFGSVRVVPSRRQVTVDSRDIKLTNSEYNILVGLMEAEGDVKSRAELKDLLGSEGHGQKDRIVDVHVAALRKKLGKGGVIKTVHGHGYRIADEG
jgi:DNA-binding response OmpR family regulator